MYVFLCLEPFVKGDKDNNIEKMEKRYTNWKQIRIWMKLILI